jgi:hypothetical protein
MAFSVFQLLCPGVALQFVVVRQSLAPAFFYNIMILRNKTFSKNLKKELT